MTSTDRISGTPEADPVNPVSVSNGGTGLASYTIGDVLYASGTTTLSKLAGVAAGNVLLSGGVGTAPAWGKVALATHVSGVLSVANGGSGLAALAGADIASAATLDLSAATGPLVRITGTTATSAVTLGTGQTVTCVAVAAWPLTHHATTNPLPGSVNYTCAAGDVVRYHKDGNGAIHVEITKADGTAVVAASGGGKVQDFRLTLTTGLPVTTADVTGATTIYCTPYKGNSISLYSGSAWVTRTSAEFSLALGTITSGKPYDVFCYDNAGTPTLEFLVWTNDTTRATALAYQDGVLCKTGALTRRYLGTFYTTATTTTEDSAAKRYLWNYYNRVNRKLYVEETVVSWTYSTASWEQVRGSSANQVNFVVGVAEDVIVFNGASLVSTSTATARFVGSAVGIDSVTNPYGSTGAAAVTSSTANTTAFCTEYIPTAGRHYAALLEYGAGADTQTWYGAGVGGQLTWLNGGLWA